MIEGAGIRVGIVSGGGAGTFDITGNIEGVDEIQAGSYALMDQSYSLVRPELVVARWVLATVLSANTGCAVVDVGTKGMGCEFGLPVVEGFPAAKARYNAEEHTPFEGRRQRAGGSFARVHHAESPPADVDHARRQDRGRLAHRGGGLLGVEDSSRRHYAFTTVHVPGRSVGSRASTLGTSGAVSANRLLDARSAMKMSGSFA